MFICNDCLEKNYNAEPAPQWSQAKLFCEVCEKEKPCNDMPTWFLLNHKKVEGGTPNG